MTRGHSYLGVGQAFATLVSFAGLVTALFLAFPAPNPAEKTLVLTGLALAFPGVYAAQWVAILVHELGHFVAARLMRQPVNTVQIGSPPTIATIRFGTVSFHLGPGPRGRVSWGADEPSAGRTAIVAFAGPAANLLTAPLWLALPVHGTIKYAPAVIFASTFLSNLVPSRSAKTGRLSDGARLFRAPARSRSQRQVRDLLEQPNWHTQPDCADILLRGYRLEVRPALQRWPALALLLKADGRARDLLWLHHQPTYQPGSPTPQTVDAVHQLEWSVVSMPDVPLADANLAGRRLPWVLKHIADEHRPAALHTMAVIRFRQRQYAMVEPLCVNALAADLPPENRATVLATVAMARHALGGADSGRVALDEALQLAPKAELVNEAVAFLARPRPSDPALAKALARRQRTSALHGG